MQITPIENELRMEGQQPCPHWNWLNNSYGAGQEFWQSFKEAADEIFPVKTTSTLFKRYNFYHDLILRNINNSNPAFIFYEGKSGLKNLSYQELHERASAKAALWKAQGVENKKTVCVIRTTGVELMIELAAALQIGCRIAFLPPQGRSYLQKRLALLEPEHISLDQRDVHLLSAALREKVLSAAGTGSNMGNEKSDYFNYAPDRPVFAVFEPSTEKLTEINEIKSNAVYLGALRDGLIALGLGPGRSYAAPGFNFLETCPGIFLAGFMCGATYLHLTAQDIKENPQLVTAVKIHAFGVSRTVRDILSAAPVNADGVWQTWFRNPAASADMDAWHLFSRRLNLLNSYSFNLRWSAAGCNLFSVRRKGTAHAGVLPAFGSNWQLSDPSGTGEKSLSDFGILSILPPGASIEEEKKQTGDMIAAKGGEWLFLGVRYLNREGRFYPAAEILEVLTRMKRSIYFSLVKIPQADSSGGFLIVLLAFYGDEKDFAKERAAVDIRKIIGSELAEEDQPDKIDFFPLYPRFSADGTLDHDWCRTEYSTGRLQKKAKDKIYLNVTKMRKYLIKRSILTTN